VSSFILARRDSVRNPSSPFARGLTQSGSGGKAREEDAASVYGCEAREEDAASVYANTGIP